MIDLKQSYRLITWDIGNKLINVSYFGKVDDSGRGLKIKLIQNSIVVTPTTETLKIYLKKPDGTAVYIDAIINGQYFEITLTNQVYAVAGTVKAELQLKVGDNWITSDTFAIVVDENLVDGSILSSNDFVALQDALTRVNELEDTVQEASSNAQTAVNNANEAVQTANNLTQQVIAETLIIWVPYVATYDDIAAIYPIPETGWTTIAQDTGIRWRYNDTTWVNIGVEPTDKVGDTTQLPTTDKTNVVNSIKEVSGQLASKANQTDVSNHLADLVTDADGVHGLKVENGTFTPYIYGSTVAGTNVYNTQQGKYHKIGKLVFASVYVYITTKDANMSGQARIGGMPFTQAGEPRDMTSVYFRLVDLADTAKNLMAYNAGNYMLIEEVYDNAVTAIIDSTAIKNGTIIRLSTTYLTV